MERWTLDIGPVTLEVEAESKEEAMSLMMRECAEAREKIADSVDAMERVLKEM